MEGRFVRVPVSVFRWVLAVGGSAASSREEPLLAGGVEGQQDAGAVGVNVGSQVVVDQLLHGGWVTLEAGNLPNQLGCYLAAAMAKAQAV